MSDLQAFFQANQQMWDAHTPIHVKSDFYNMEQFRATKNSLNTIETELLGSIRGKRILHLQCHFGQDSISLAHLGAEVTAVDFSGEAIKTARHLAQELQEEVQFIEANIFDLPNVLQDTFDYVFTSYGVIAWFPDLDAWAKLIAQYLNPGGQLVLVEFHPVIWMLNEQRSAFEFSYFNSGVIKEVTEGTYAEVDAEVRHESFCWNHSLGEVMGGLKRAGLSIEDFQEYDYSPYDCLPDMILGEKGYQFKEAPGRFPLVFSLICQKHL